MPVCCPGSFAAEPAKEHAQRRHLQPSTVDDEQTLMTEELCLKCSCEKNDVSSNMFVLTPLMSVLLVVA